MRLGLKLGELPRVQRYLKEYKEAGLGRQNEVTIENRVDEGSIYCIFA